MVNADWKPSAASLVRLGRAIEFAESDGAPDSGWDGAVAVPVDRDDIAAAPAPARGLDIPFGPSHC